MRKPAEAVALERTVLLARDFVPLEIKDEGVVRALRTPTAALVAEGDNLRSRTGQTLVVTLAQLVVASGAGVRFSFPEAPLAGPQPPIVGRRLRAGLVGLLRDSMPRARVSIGSVRRGDAVFVVGDSPAPRDCGPAHRVWARPWAGGISAMSERVSPCRGGWTTGAAIAASIAAAEVVKLALRPLVSTNRHALLEQLATVSDAQLAVWDGDEHPAALDLGAIDLVSGGAISSAALHSLLRHANVRGHARVIEPDRLALNNLNRYPLMRLSQLGFRKIDALTAWQTRELAIDGVPLRLEASTLQNLRPFRSRVLVGVDDIPSRWVIQREWPDWLAIGGTVHFTAVVSDHRRAPGCAGCIHPRDDGVAADVPTVAFVSYLAGALLAARLLLEACGRPSSTAARALEVATLRLDLAGATWRHPVVPNPACPVRCQGGADVAPLPIPSHEPLP